MAVMDFPATPTVGQLWPDPPTLGIPQYRWDGSAWLAVAPPEGLVYVKRVGDTMTGPLVLPGNATLALQAVPKQQLDVVSASAIDAMAYSGMQINGSMEVSQEGSYNAGTGYVCDGWLCAKSTTAVLSPARVASASSPGFEYMLLIGVTTPASMAAADYIAVVQKIEGYRVSRLAWGTASARPITIGFWSANQLVGTYSVTIQNVSTNRTYAATYTHNASNVWQYNTITIPGDTTGTWDKTNGKGLQLNFAVAAGTTYTAPSANTWLAGNYLAAPGQINGAGVTTNFHITGVVVLPGIYAPTAAQSPLIMRPYGEELATCQRYWNKMLASARFYAHIASEHFVTVISHPSMRATPTLAFTSAGSQSNIFAGYPIISPSGTQNTIQLDLANAAAGDCFILSAVFSLDARL